MASTQKINTIIKPSNADKTLSWVSTNTAVASVSNDGTVTGVKAGSVKITATTINNLVAECDVVVGQNPREITLNKNSITGIVEETFQLIPTFLPDNTTETDITWSSSNDAVATVSSNGLVNFNSVGMAVVTATTINGLTSTCDVEVVAQPTFDYVDEIKGSTLLPSARVNSNLQIELSNTADSLKTIDYFPRTDKLVELKSNEIWEIEYEIEFNEAYHNNANIGAQMDMYVFGSQYDTHDNAYYTRNYTIRSGTNDYWVRPLLICCQGNNYFLTPSDNSRNGTGKYKFNIICDGGNNLMYYLDDQFMAIETLPSNSTALKFDMIGAFFLDSWSATNPVGKFEYKINYIHIKEF